MSPASLINLSRSAMDVKRKMLWDKVIARHDELFGDKKE